ncbi:MAG: caspase family protein, partial [Hyphomicrobiales bacterium]
LNVVRGLDVLPIDRVFQALYRPDLVHEALAGDPAGRVRDAAARLDLASALDSGPPPAVRFAGPANGASVPAGETLVAASITDQGGGIGRIEWRVNGVTLGVDERGLARIEMPAKASTVERRLILGPGDNVVELVAYNAGDLVASEPARLALTVAAPDDTAPPRLHVLAVGINDYWDSRLRLNFAVPDARSVAEALARAGAGLFASVDVETLFDADVTTAGLDRRFSEIAAKVAPQDVFVFFLAGHGKTVEGRYYFLPYDFRYEGEPSITAAGIGQDVWQQWFARIPAGRSVLLYDTCESGSLTGDGLGTRGLERVAAMERITRAMGRTVLSAATDDQPALEGYRGHGVFTWTLLDALANADTDADNEIAVTELAGYVDRKVPEISEAAFGLRQIPQMRIVGSNFPLGARVAVLGDAPAATLPVEPTHVLIRAAVVRAGADADAPELIELSPGTQVRLIETSGAVAHIARDGRPLGFVPIDALVRLQ